MNKLEVGMYVITTDRLEIGKIIHFCECEKCKARGFDEPILDNPNIFITNYDKENGFHGYKFYESLIGLIEVGDYVNGSKLLSIDYAEDRDGNCDKLHFYYSFENDEKDVNEYYEELNIKSIVTKEQFKSMEYRLGE